MQSTYSCGSISAEKTRYHWSAVGEVFLCTFVDGHLFPRFPAETLGKSDMSGKSQDITGHSGQLAGVEVCLCTFVGGWPLVSQLRLLARLVGVAKDKICSQLVEASWVLLGCTLLGGCLLLVAQLRLLARLIRYAGGCRGCSSTRRPYTFEWVGHN